MPIRIPFVVGGVLLVGALLVTACGSDGVDTGVNGQGNDGPTSTMTIPVGTPGKAPMTNVTITTDRSSYASGDTIHVTATNRLGKPVFASDGKASCTIFELEMKTGQGWQAVSVAPCTRQDQTSMPVQLAAGASHTATINTQEGATFPAGTYRVALRYSTYTIPPPMAAASRDNMPLSMRRAGATPSPLATAYSSAFTIG